MGAGRDDGPSTRRSAVAASSTCRADAACPWQRVDVRPVFFARPTLEYLADCKRIGRDLQRRSQQGHPPLAAHGDSAA